jgi:hypothetical protein
LVPLRLLRGPASSSRRVFAYHGVLPGWPGLRPTPPRMRSLVARARMSGRHWDTSTSPGSPMSRPVNSSWIWRAPPRNKPWLSLTCIDLRLPSSAATLDHQRSPWLTLPKHKQFKRYIKERGKGQEPSGRPPVVGVGVWRGGAGASAPLGVQRRSGALRVRRGAGVVGVGPVRPAGRGALRSASAWPVSGVVRSARRRRSAGAGRGASARDMWVSASCSFPRDIDPAHRDIGPAGRDIALLAASTPPTGMHAVQRIADRRRDIHPPEASPAARLFGGSAMG